MARPDPREPRRTLRVRAPGVRPFVADDVEQQRVGRGQPRRVHEHVHEIRAPGPGTEEQPARAVVVRVEVVPGHDPVTVVDEATAAVGERDGPCDHVAAAERDSVALVERGGEVREVVRCGRVKLVGVDPRHDDERAAERLAERVGEPGVDGALRGAGRRTCGEVVVEVVEQQRRDARARVEERRRARGEALEVRPPVDVSPGEVDARGEPGDHVHAEPARPAAEAREGGGLLLGRGLAPAEPMGRVLLRRVPPGVHRVAGERVEQRLALARCEQPAVVALEVADERLGRKRDHGGPGRARPAGRDRMRDSMPPRRAPVRRATGGSHRGGWL